MNITFFCMICSKRSNHKKSCAIYLHSLYFTLIKKYFTKKHVKHILQI